MSEIKPFRGEDGKYHFLYITKNIINKKIYIGVHSTDNLDDGYIGCGLKYTTEYRLSGVGIFKTK